MTTLHFSLLGHPELRYGNEPVHFVTRKALALLVYQAVEGGLHSREKLLTLLWPEGGRTALRSAWAYVRKGLDAAAPQASIHFLHSELDVLGFNAAAPHQIDLANLQSLVSQSHPSAWITALEFIRGPFLDGFSLPDAPAFDEWVRFRREQTDQQIHSLLERLSGWQVAERQFEAGIGTAIRWVAHDPLHEAAHRRLMELYSLAGHSAAAWQAYEQCQAILQTELGLTPSRETQQLAERIRQQRPPAGTLTPRPAPARQPDIPFVGRAEPHAQLVKVYQKTSTGQTQLAIIEGEPGIGKTRLAEEFGRWLEIRGAVLLVGRAFEAGGRLPYQPLVDALRGRIEHENAPDDLLSDVWLAELSRLLPELRERYPDLPEPTGDEALARTRLPEAIARLGEALSSPPRQPAHSRPVVWWVDDVQWADVASLDVLAYCGRAWANAHLPILVLCTLRPENLTPALNEWLIHLGRILPLHRVPLGPLSAQDTAQLINQLSATADNLSTRFSQWLYQETAGHPFFIGETLKALAEQEITWDTIGELRGAIPPGVRQLILSRLQRLSPAATTMLTAVAVLGRPASLVALQHTSGLNDEETVTAVEELLARQLLRETAESHRPYTYSHDKIRDVAYEAIGSARRQLVHRRALEHLANSHAAATECARHALAASLSEPAYRYSILAGDEALRLFATRDAIPQYEQARQLLIAHRLVWDEPLYLQLGRAYEITNQREAAKVVYEELLALAQRDGNAAAECTALNRLATLAAQDVFDLTTAKNLLQQAVAAAERSGDRLALAETQWNLAQIIVYTFDMEAAYAQAKPALALARELNQPDLLARCLNTLAFIEGGLGLWPDVETHGLEAVEVCRMIGHQALEADSLCTVARAQTNLGRAEEAVGPAQLAHEMNLKAENHWGTAVSAIHLAWALLECGRVDEALPIAQQGSDLARTMLDFAPLPILNLTVLGMIHREKGALETAVQVHLEALGVSQARPQSPLLRMIAVELCADYAMLGQWEQALDYANLSLTSPYHDLLHGDLTQWLTTEAWLRGGEFVTAEAQMVKLNERYAHNPRYQQIHQRCRAVWARWRVGSIAKISLNTPVESPH